MEKFKSFIKNIYYLIPFKRSFYDILKQFYLPPKSIYRFLVHKQIFTLNIKGKKLKLKHPGFHFYIENEFYWKGYEKSGFEVVSRELWLKLSSHSQTILDVGANTGLYSLFASLFNPSSSIHAFEPIKRNVDKLRLNIAINQMENIKIVEAAISQTDGTTTIYQPSTDVSTTSTLDIETAKSRDLNVNPEQIETVRIDTYIDEHKLEKVDLIKIDVEGFEVPVFESMGKYLKLMQPTILAEIRVEENGNQIMDMLKDCGYVYFDIDEKSEPKQVKEITKSSNVNFLICTSEVATSLQLQLVY